MDPTLPAKKGRGRREGLKVCASLPPSDGRKTPSLSTFYLGHNAICGATPLPHFSHRTTTAEKEKYKSSRKARGYHLYDTPWKVRILGVVFKRSPSLPPWYDPLLSPGSFLFASSFRIGSIFLLLPTFLLSSSSSYSCRIQLLWPPLSSLPPHPIFLFPWTSRKILAFSI